jgi:hypothetical protein
MPIRAIAVCLLGLTLCPMAIAAAADRGPSTPAERKQALEIIRRYQADPLNPDLKTEIQWVVEWTREVPDIRLDLCTSFYKLKTESKDGEIIFDAMLLAQTAFVLENPDRQDDGPAQVEAGAEGVLHVYEAMIKGNPRDREPFLDKLITQREAGTLAQFVKQHAPSVCEN